MNSGRRWILIELIVSIPVELYGETKNVCCVRCKAKQRIIFTSDAHSAGIMAECQNCGSWFQIYIEEGEQRPQGYPPDMRYDYNNRPTGA